MKFIPNHYIKKIFLFVGVFLFALTVKPLLGQNEECAFTLEKAEKLFEEGFINEIPDMLTPCLEKGFTKEERLAAYKLIILAYVFDDRKKEAEDVMLSFLKKYPEYEVLPTDPVEFVYMYESYRTFSAFTVGLFGGINSSIIQLGVDNGVGNTLSDVSDYWAKSSLYGGVRMSRYITDEIDVQLEVVFKSNSFSSSSMVATKENTYTENQSFISFPVTGVYSFTHVKYVTPYVRLGLSPGFLINAEGTLLGEYVDKSKLPVEDNVSSWQYRNPFALWAVSGAGVKYGVPRGVLSLDLRYNWGLTNLSEDESRFNLADDYLWSTGLVDDQFKLSNFVVTVGYNYIFYTSKKIK